MKNTLSIITFVIIAIILSIIIKNIYERINYHRIKRNVREVKEVKEDKSLKAIKKGKIGEEVVKNTLQQLDKKKYLILNDVLLETSHGTSQIDHIVFSIHGIFVLETKNYSGLIVGDENNPKWTQQLHNKINTFRNPIIQNYSHIKALQETLNINNDTVFNPIVVFSASDAIVSVDTFNSHVTPLKYLMWEIDSVSKKVFSSNEINEFYQIVKHKNIKSRKKRLQHVERLNKKYTY